jgi:hypothetical protein
MPTACCAGGSTAEHARACGCRAAVCRQLGEPHPVTEAAGLASEAGLRGWSKVHVSNPFDLFTVKPLSAAHRHHIRTRASRFYAHLASTWLSMCLLRMPWPPAHALPCRAHLSCMAYSRVGRRVQRRALMRSRGLECGPMSRSRSRECGPMYHSTCEALLTRPIFRAFNFVQAGAVT